MTLLVKIPNRSFYKNIDSNYYLPKFLKHILNSDILEVGFSHQNCNLILATKLDVPTVAVTEKLNALHDIYTN